MAKQPRAPDSGMPYIDPSEEFKDDPKYTKYVQQVERILQSFDYINEWADVTAFLTKLRKAFQSYQQFHVIPATPTVAKRLAQCLNPALPTGVHQKTLELYTFVFQKITPEQLRHDLPLYSYGLFPFLKYSATAVKPTLLSIFEVYYLPLKGHLRGCIKGFLLALLPGLEEENSDHFDQVLSLLDRVRDGIEPQYFYQALFLCLTTATDLRSAGLHYLARRVPQVSQLEDVVFVVGDDPSLMIHAFAATLRDPNLLVQRAILDILLTKFPLASGFFQGADQALLVGGAVEVILRRDMSLNRRLYSWFLGKSDSRRERQKHFQTWVRQPLVQALRNQFAISSAQLATLQKPYKIVMSLLDRSEIGVPLVQEIVFDALACASQHAAVSPIPEADKLLQTARMLFEMTDPYLIWSQVMHRIQYILAETTPLTKATLALNQLTFLVDDLYVNEDENTHVHVPLVVVGVLSWLATWQAASIPQLALVLPLTAWLQKLLARIPAKVLGVVASVFDPLVSYLAPFPEDGDDGAPESALEKVSGLASFRQGPGAGVDAFYHTGVYAQSSKDAMPSKGAVQALHDRVMAAMGNQRSHSSPLAYDRVNAQSDSLGVLLRQQVCTLVDIYGQAVCHTSSTFEHNGTTLPMLTAKTLISADVKGWRTLREVVGQTLCDLLALLETLHVKMPEGSPRVPQSPLHSPTAARTEKTDHSHPVWLQQLFACLTTTPSVRLMDAGLSFVLNCISNGLVPWQILQAPLDSAALRSTTSAPGHLVSAAPNHTVADAIIERLWGFLSPELSQGHLQVVELLWRLVPILGLTYVESRLAQFMTTTDVPLKEVAMARFTVFWSLSERITWPASDPIETARESLHGASSHHQSSLLYHQFHPLLSFSRLMLLALDCLDDPQQSGLRRIVESWVRTTVGCPQRIVNAFVALLLLDPSMIRQVESVLVGADNDSAVGAPESIHVLIYQREFNVAQITYVLGRFLLYCRTAGQPLLHWLLHTQISDVVTDLFDQLAQTDSLLLVVLSSISSCSYLDLVLEILFQFVLSHTAVHPPASARIASNPLAKPKTVQAHPTQQPVLHLATYLISQSSYLDIEIRNRAETCVVHQLYYSVQHALVDYQPDLLRLLLALAAVPTQPNLAPRLTLLPRTSLPHEANQQLVAVNMDRTFSSGDGNRLATAALFQPLPSAIQASQQPPVRTPRTPRMRSTIPLLQPLNASAAKAAQSTANLVESSLFTRTLLDALSLSSNRPVLRAWVDFLSLSLGQFRHLFARTLWPTAVLLCLQLRDAREQLQLLRATPPLPDRMYEVLYAADVSHKLPRRLSLNPASSLSEQGTAAHAYLPLELQSLCPGAFNIALDGTMSDSSAAKRNTSSHDTLQVAWPDQVLILFDGLESLLVYCLTNNDVLEDRAKGSETQQWSQSGVYTALTRSRRHPIKSSRGHSASISTTPAADFLSHGENQRMRSGSTSSSRTKSTAAVASAGSSGGMTTGVSPANSPKPSSHVGAQPSGLRYLADVVSNVFVANDSTAAPSTSHNPRQAVRDTIVTEMPSIIKVILDLWAVVTAAPVPSSQVLPLPYQDISHRISVLLTHLASVCPVALFEAVIEAWFHHNRLVDFTKFHTAANSLRTLVPSAPAPGAMSDAGNALLSRAGMAKEPIFPPEYLSTALDMLGSVDLMAPETMLVLAMDGVLARTVGGTVRSLVVIPSGQWGAASRHDAVYSTSSSPVPNHMIQPDRSVRAHSVTASENSLGSRSSGPLVTPFEPGYYSPAIDHVSDLALLKFMEVFMMSNMVTAKTMLTVSPALLHFVHSFTSTPINAYKHVMPLLMRVFTVAHVKLTNEGRADDSRQRHKDVVEAYYKLMDQCVAVIGRTLDTGLAHLKAQLSLGERTNRTASHESLATSSTDCTSKPATPPSSTQTSSSAVAATGSSPLHPVAASHHPNLSKLAKVTDEALVLDMLTYLGHTVLPWGSWLVPDTERLQSLAASIMYHVGSPFLRGKVTFIAPILTLPGQAIPQPLHPLINDYHINNESVALPYHMAHLIVMVLVQLANIPLVFKTWKKDVWDYFIDTTGFFVYYAMTPPLLRQWATLVNAVATSERDKVSDLLARITTASPSNLFVNREAEAIAKALYLRKLAFVVFSGAQDQYLPLLPTVQEKLVELLKMPQLATLVHIEVYLCLRVLLCRVSGRYLSNFWPVLLTDMMSQFTSILAERHEPSLDQINLFLAMCKFLDLLVTLETGEFQHHQWMFITDTIDALYGTRSDSYALLDRMSDQLLTFGMSQVHRKGKSPIGSPTHPTRAIGTTSATQTLTSSSATGKRPLITAGAITSLQELEPFIHNISLHTYQATYSLSQPDTTYIEEWLERDLIFTTIYGSPSVASGTRHSANSTRPSVLNDIVSGL